jgi:radical SAM protein with 4Fe4S-binding SPASM domain
MSSARKLIKKAYELLPWSVKSTVRDVFPSMFVPSLYKQLPLGVPQSLHIDIGNLCNFRCTFCPTGDSALLESVNRPKGMMGYELFQKIIDDLKTMADESGQKVAEMHLYKDGEPLIHKDLGKIISYAKKSGTALSVETTTNAALLTKEKAIEIIESGLDVLRVSVEHVNSEGYKRITQNFSDYNKIKENVKFLFEEKTRRGSGPAIKVKIVDVNLSAEELTKFHRDFSPICDIININQLMGWSNSGKKDFTLGVDVKRAMGGVAKLMDKKICPEPFRSLAINFNGEVSVCCVDWSFGTLVGDVSKTSLKDIWNGKELNEFRRKHYTGQRGLIEACRDCHYLKGFADHLVLDGKK